MFAKASSTGSVPPSPSSTTIVTLSATSPNPIGSSSILSRTSLSTVSWIVCFNASKSTSGL